jgi:aquaporin Z
VTKILNACKKSKTFVFLRLMKKYIVELIGTFFLVFTVGNTVIGKSDVAPLAIGLSLAVMIFAGGHISGGHFNPAVTLGVWLRGKCDTKDVVPYIASQIIGAVLAAFAVKFLQGTGGTAGDVKLGQAFVAELLGTFALVWVVLNVATTKANANNSFYGLAIGMTVTAMAFALGPISGAAFNPAVAIGAMAMGMIKSGNLWIYLVACPLGGLIAAQLFKSIKADE